MAKKKQAATLPVPPREEPIDLLAVSTEEESDTSGAPGTYTLEVADKTLELTLDQLLDLAARCLEADMGREEGLGQLADVPQLLEFVQQYPDVQQFPEPVAEFIRQGKSPLEAYRAYENEELRGKLRAMEQNEANQKMSPGSARGQADGRRELDDMMALFQSVFK